MSKTTGLTGTVTRVHLAAVALIAMIAATAPTHALADTLYVGDTSDNSIKGFDTDTGDYLGAIVKKSRSGLHAGQSHQVRLILSAPDGPVPVVE
jgi:hypothetical protein